MADQAKQSDRKEYPKVAGTFGDANGDVIERLFAVGYDLAVKRADLLKEQESNRTALRSLKSVMTPEQVTEVDAMYHERTRKAAK